MVLNSELKKIIFQPGYLKECIKKQNTYDKLQCFFDDIELDLKNIIEKVNSTTTLKIFDVGNFFNAQTGIEDWKNIFIFNEPKTPQEIMFESQSPLEVANEQVELKANIWNTQHVINKLEQNTYREKYAEEIKMVCEIFDKLDFIETERRHYSEKLNRYSETNSFSLPNGEDNKLKNFFMHDLQNQIVKPARLKTQREKLKERLKDKDLLNENISQLAKTYVSDEFPDLMDKKKKTESIRQEIMRLKKNM
jgi:hypothetical protein